MWLLEQGLWLLVGFLIFVAVTITGAIWAVLDWVESSRLNIFPRLLICLLAIIAGWISIGGAIGFSLLNYQGISSFLKSLYEGPWISVVIFKAAPDNGKYWAIPFVLSFTAFHGYLAYSAFFGKEDFTTIASYGYLSIFAMITTIASYLSLLRLQDKAESHTRK